jgi:hypothetical protein
LDGNPGQLNGANPFRIAYGQVAPSIGRVVIDTTDGLHVNATVHGGRFFAWWPTGADPATITGLAADGTAMTTLHPVATDRSPSPAHKPTTR